VAEALNVWVIGVGSGGAEDQQVAAVSVIAEPAEGFVEILTATHEGVSGVGMDVDVGGRSDPEILVCRNRLSLAAERHGQQQKKGGLHMAARA